MTTSGMSTPLRVLILEDRQADAELMLHELRQAGFEPDWCRVETEKDYLAHLHRGADLILSDYNLPGFDAVRALELLLEKGLDIPFLIVSGRISEEVAVECVKRGAADYLLKDRLGRLGPAVARVLEAKRLREAKRAAEIALREGEARYRQELERTVEERTRALQEAQAELVEKERLAMLGQLAGGMAHELRNPLGVIKNSVYYLKMVLPEDERAGRHLRILDREVGTADRIVTNLLDFARARPPDRSPSDLSLLVREILERAPLPENVDVVARLAEDLPLLSVDPLQVQQVVGNLIVNGAQAMPEGGTLTIETARAGGGAQVVVSDTGVGIPPENLGKIFQPLFTTKAKGIGLGLALARRFAEANGGTISVESTPGRGSRFVVHFAQPRDEG